MTSNEIFAKMLDWIFANTDARYNTDVARKADINATSISRILNGQVKKVSQDTLRTVNAAYGNVFNPEWLRGKSSVMLVSDLSKPETEPEDGQQPAPAAPDMSSLFNAVIAANDQAITSLKRELAAKEETIAELRGRIDDKDEIIRQKDRHINGLEQQIRQMQAERGLLSGQSVVGVAEKDKTRPRP